jgi:hypothetical protein
MFGRLITVLTCVKQKVALKVDSGIRFADFVVEWRQPKWPRDPKIWDL